MKKIFFLTFMICITACTPQPARDIPPTEIQPTNTQTEEVAMSFEITSPAFINGASIPSDFSCDGRDVSPALTWTEPPAGTQSFASSWMTLTRR